MKQLLCAAVFLTFFIPSGHAYVDEVVPTLETFSAYKPTYFLLGNPDTKAQLSLKLQPIESFPLFFGYSQLLMWDLFQSSARIRDIDYNPEFFFRFPFGDNNARRWLDVSPFEHESDGAGEFRSWNRAYVRYSDSLLIGQRVYWSLKLWLPYADQTGELPKYRGIGELTATLSDFLGQFWKRGDLTLRLYPGGASFVNPFLGGQELTLRVKLQEPHVLPLLVFQVFHGYGEDLLDYNQERFSLRFGIGL